MIMPDRALVLSGGGATASFQIGVLEELIMNQRLDFRILCGMSGGAPNSAILAQARYDDKDPQLSLANLQSQFAALRRIWLEEITGPRSVYRLMAGARSLYNPAPLRRMIKQHIDSDRLLHSNRVLKVTFVSLGTGEQRTADGRSPHIVDQVMASVSVPFFFPPVEVEQDLLV